MDTKELNRIIRNQNQQIARRIAGGAAKAIAAFKAPELMTLAFDGGINLQTAQNALAASHRALAELARRATGPTRIHYKKLMDIVLAELKTVTQAILDNLGGQYAPMTATLKASAGQLSSAYTTAKATISDMNNAAELLAGFKTLIAAL